MDQIEVDVIGFQPLQLLFKNRLRFGRRLDKEFCGEIKAIAGIFLKRAAQEALGIPIIVDIGGVIVVDAVAHGVVDDLLGLYPVDFSIGSGRPLCLRQNHVSQTET